MSPYSTLPNIDTRFKNNCNITVNRLSIFHPIPPELPPPNGTKSDVIIGSDVIINSDVKILT